MATDQEALVERHGELALSVRAMTEEVVRSLDGERFLRALHSLGTAAGSIVELQQILGIDSSLEAPVVAVPEVVAPVAEPASPEAVLPVEAPAQITLAPEPAPELVPSVRVADPLPEVIPDAPDVRNDAGGAKPL